MSTSWFITGANSGFGRLMTETLLKRGDRVAATYRSAGALDDLTKTYPAALIPIQLDLTDSERIVPAVAEAFQALGHIDIVISNAGYGTFGAAEELSSDQIRRQIETNLLGSIFFIQALLPHLRKQRKGRVLQVSSEGGRISYPGFSLYHASKWGQEGFIEAVAQEVAPFGIQMCLLEPGPTGTNFLAGIDSAQPSAAYENSPVGDLRKRLESGEFSPSMGDAIKIANEMIAIAQADVMPLRVPLGSIAWNNITAKLTERQTLLSTQKDQAYRCDVDAKQASR
ncbi:short-chain dehydrogenase [Pseudomonas sp. S25]|uniref:Short-chain dehydrogenase n=1 Tax=Pseudomonas maioricensis TaxID=1766623 RepID=A0ABS9ZGU5_9PSED|nr:SDR family oxidoreductase [Pseudomonas sp. S25]MCI8209765.1 short-chain dehydrogenase [Pseudomonas sp. S25]